MDGGIEFRTFEQIKQRNPKKITGYLNFLNIVAAGRKAEQSKYPKPVIPSIELHYPSENDVVTRTNVLDDLAVVYGNESQEVILQKLQTRIRSAILENSRDSHSGNSLMRADDSLWTLDMPNLTSEQFQRISKRFPNVLKNPTYQNMVWRLLLFQSTNSPNHFLVWRCVPKCGDRRYDYQSQKLLYVSDRWQSYEWDLGQLTLSSNQQ